MGESSASRFIDVPRKERKFDEYYDHFFGVKLQPTLKKVKQLLYQCSYDCISETAVDEVCLKSCAQVQDRFLDRLSGLFSSRLASFPQCMERCKPKKDTEGCVDECTAATLQQLEAIDIVREFETFSNPATWQ